MSAGRRSSRPPGARRSSAPAKRRSTALSAPPPGATRGSTSWNRSPSPGSAVVLMSSPYRMAKLDADLLPRLQDAPDAQPARASREDGVAPSRVGIESQRGGRAPARGLPQAENVGAPGPGGVERAERE